MKALSLTQPWAWLVVHRGKRVENRKWNTKFRGEFLIHASKRMKFEDLQGAMKMQRDVEMAMTIPGEDFIPLGGIVGVAQLVNVLPPHLNDRPWSVAGQYGFLLEDVRPVEFVPWSGSLGFWEVPAEVLARVKL